MISSPCAGAVWGGKDAQWGRNSAETPQNPVHGLEMGFWGLFFLAHSPKGLLGWRGQWLWVGEESGPRS